MYIAAIISFTALADVGYARDMVIESFTPDNQAIAPGGVAQAAVGPGRRHPRGRGLRFPRTAEARA